MLGTQELVLILVAILVLIGPSKLPEIARSLGKATGEFKKAQLESGYELKRFSGPLKDKDANTDLEVNVETNIKNSPSGEKGIGHDSNKAHIPR